MVRIRNWFVSGLIAGFASAAPLGGILAEEPPAGFDSPPPGASMRNAITGLEARVAAIEARLQGFTPSAAATAVAPSDPAEDILDLPAADLRERAWATLQAGEEERAYRYYALIQQLYPGSPEAEKSFENAAKLHTRAFHRHRTTRPDSAWVTSERYFLFQWFSTYLRGETFPQAKAEALLLRLPLGAARQLRDFLSARPGRSAWEVSVREDNGRIETVTGVRIVP